MASNLSPIHLPVVTESGRQLGEVVDIIIDPNTHGIVSYLVKASRLIPNLVQSPLVIHHSQVVSIGPDKMVVDDSTQRQTTAGTVSEVSA